MSTIPVIAVDGGPCGGKSTFLVRARDYLEKYGIYPIVVSETATELINAGVTPRVMGNELFQEQLFLYSLMREERYLEIARRTPEKKTVLICDRGVLSGAAYMGAKAYREMVARHGYSREHLMSRYHMAVHLVTAADGAEQFYTLDNNGARTESPAEARALDIRTLHAWLGHPHHAIVDNTTDFAGKIRRSLCAFARILNMPEPTEIERKYKVLNFNPNLIPEEAVASHITQTYLKSMDLGERRVRKSVHDGVATYTYTEKLPTGISGKRIEKERLITESEYSMLLVSRDLALHPVSKMRYRFPFSGKIFELDVCEGNLSGRVYLEVELLHEDEKVPPPPQFELLDVTDDVNEKMSALAKL